MFAGPPCFNQCGLGHWDNYSLYSDDMRRIMQNCVGRLKQGGVLVWHIGNDSSSHHDHLAHHSRFLEELGLRYLDTIAWVKTTANYVISTFRGHHT